MSLHSQHLACTDQGGTATPTSPCRRPASRLTRLLAGTAAVALVALATACLPAWPTGGTITIASASPTSIDLAWPEPSVDPGDAVDLYEVSVDGSARTTVSGTQLSAHIADLAPATTYTLSVRARDTLGRWSNPALTGQATTSPATAPIVERRTLVHGGLTRTYRLDIPAGYSGSTGARLVLGLHGGLSSADGFANYTRFPSTSAANGWIMAYPEGVTGPQGFRTWNGGGCCGHAQATNVDDTGFVTAVIGELKNRFAVTKVALTGHSNGAILSYRIACEAPEAVDGVAIWSGTVFVDPCSPTKPVSLMHLHGLSDTNIPFGGGTGSGVSGASFPPVMEGIETIRQAYGCSSPPTTGATNGVVTYTWSCPAGAAIRLVTVDDANHEWPGGLDTVLPGTPSTKIDATAMIASLVNGL